MRHSKRSLEGELFIDHRNSPGLTAADVAGTGIDPAAVAGGTVYEAPILTCSHCQYAVVMNPKRDRPRAWCAKCDKYLCDACAYIMHRTLECRNMTRVLDDTQEQIERYGSEFGVSPLLLS
jgi:hypothetical protein